MDRQALITAMASAMGEVNDLDVSREQFAEAACAVLEQQKLITWPQDRLDLMDDLTAAMWDTETGPDWNTPCWHPYANAILAVLSDRKLLAGV